MKNYIYFTVLLRDTTETIKIASTFKEHAIALFRQKYGKRTILAIR